MFLSKSDLGVLNMSDLFKNFSIKTKYGAVAATATPIVIFAGIYVAWAYIRHGWRRRSKPRRVLSRSMSLAVLHGGKLALDRLVDYHKARAEPATLDAAETELRNLIGQENPDFKGLEVTIAKLEMSGKENEAISMLEEALKNAKKENRPHEAYEFQMLLVEMHIYKGDFSKALRYQCLEEKAVTDVRRPLFKAMLYVMIGNSKEVQKNWKEFQEMRAHYQWPPGMRQDIIYKEIHDFQEFQKVVKLLKEDIDQVHKPEATK